MRQYLLKGLVAVSPASTRYYRWTNWSTRLYRPNGIQTRWSGPRHPGEASALVEIVELDWPAGILLVHDAVTLGPAFCLPAPTFPTRLAARPGTACIRGTDEALPVANRQYLRDGSESVVAYWV